MSSLWCINVIRIHYVTTYQSCFSYYWWDTRAHNFIMHYQFCYIETYFLTSPVNNPTVQLSFSIFSAMPSSPFFLESIWTAIPGISWILIDGLNPVSPSKNMTLSIKKCNVSSKWKTNERKLKIKHSFYISFFTNLSYLSAALVFTGYR